MKNLVYNALLAEAEAEKAEAIAVLHTYMHHSVGIGEHPQIIDEAKKYLTKLADAEDRLQTLRFFLTSKASLKINNGVFKFQCSANCIRRQLVCN